VGPPGRLTGPVPTRWQGRLPRGVPPGRLALLSGEAQDQLESALAQLQGCRRSYDRPPKGAVGHGDVATTAQDRSWAASGWLPYGLELDMADGRRGTSSESLEDLQARCVKPAKQVFLGWSYVDSLPPVVINNCMSIPITELIPTEALHLSIVPIAAGGELLLLTEQKGSIYVLPGHRERRELPVFRHYQALREVFQGRFLSELGLAVQPAVCNGSECWIPDSRPAQGTRVQLHVGFHSGAD
ncbi:unnamed protein product, partial [Prorocentrum cordatum]